MGKVLISIIANVDDHDRLDELYDQFEKKGFFIEVFDVGDNTVELDHLPDIIKYVKEQERYNEGIERISLLSNMNTLLFSWYRCYNSLVNDFIYFENKTENSHLNSLEHQAFITQLSQFNNIESEKVEGKIYFSINKNHLNQLPQFLLFNKRFIYFDDIDNFDNNESLIKEAHSKEYFYAGIEYSFIKDDSIHIQKVSIKDKLGYNLAIDTEWSELLRSNSYFSFYGPLGLYQIQDVKKHEAIINIFDFIASWDSNSQQKVYDQYTDYLENTNVDFAEQIYFLSLLVKLDIKDDLLEVIINRLKRDEEWIPYHYPLLLNSLSYIAKEKLSVYPGLYRDRKLIFDKIVEFYRPKIKINKVNRRNKKIAIIAGQMLHPNHAPTMLTLNYLKSFKEHCPSYDIKVFTEDMFSYSPNEVVFPYSFSSVASSTCEELHDQFLNFNPNIYYTDVLKERKKRIQEDIENVISFEPDLLLVVGTNYSFVTAYLKDYLPIINYSMGGAASPSDADIYISGYKKEEILKEYDYYNISNINYVQYHLGLSFPEPKQILNREEYHLFEDDYVLITVGNRLDADITNDFIDLICRFIKKNSDMKWLIVGEAQHAYLKENYSKLIEDHKIIFKDYTADLAALYKICDVFVNPFREGGGFSGAMAMKQSLPIVTLEHNSDVAAYVGSGYSSRSLDDYELQLTKLYSNQQYSVEVGIEMKRRIDEDFGFERAIYNMINIFNQAKTEFNERKMNKISY